eukprot:SAG25_NODE_8742_length_406_cov_1.351792_1_plen_27_part_01
MVDNSTPPPGVVCGAGAKQCKDHFSLA